MCTAKHNRRVFPNILPQTVNTYTVHIPVVTSSNKTGNTEGRSCNHCRSRKAVCITYSEWVFVAFVIQHPMQMFNIILSFDVHGSVHHDNVYVQLKVQLDVHVFIRMLYSCIFLLYMFRVLFAPILRSTNLTVLKCECVPASTCSNGLSCHKHYTYLWLYSTVCAPEDGCK
jgi:hypothetical protein